ncbi:hypothetical protein SEA_MASHLEY_41 [Microbacterium phage Mashley]|uniref:Uncharacterized protein n=3 Tax=Squashvirus TaxID=2733215 RepID=A0A2U8UIY1_9CAUD|nr:hypothetical protein HOT27_gp042 [Microbacterium phage Hyperion]YP_009801784.1 hypothetical protein HOT29_gp045 [Microbacterium phage Squash]QED11858.1 hypothetical protein SEA_MASHLEY_41 [Microbacterium phage Mashley]QIQ63626.1 hypothetical protein SEA_NIKE_43 [Microbacterium phage Nike]QNL30011.1 hypothetical protein SEA_CASEND_44 [Microbacterium phage Casend]QQO39223.1 hypothetical protein SEA_RUDY_41 [Microbacterium phage Rudy]QQO39444.1 hypothetical protein SEA_NAMAGO_43 [Microbacteri
MSTEDPERAEQRAEKNLEAAITRARTGAVAVRNWQSVLSEFKGMYEENGFGRDVKLIFMQTVRES